MVTNTLDDAALTESLSSDRFEKMGRRSDYWRGMPSGKTKSARRGKVRTAAWRRSARAGTKRTGKQHRRLHVIN